MQGRGCLRIRVPKESDLKSKFLLYYLRQSALDTIWLNLSDNTASPSISVKAIADLPVPIPSLERQELYVATIEAYEALQVAASETQHARRGCDE